MRGGHWGLLETEKPHKKSPKTEKPKYILIKTENRIHTKPSDGLHTPISKTLINLIHG